MYINDIHIVYYILVTALGAAAGQFSDWITKRSIDEKKIFSKDLIKEYKTNYKPNFVLMAITVLIYVILLSVKGVGETFYSNIPLLVYLFIVPILISIFRIDYKLQIIPNRLNLTLFEVGLVSMFIMGFANVNIAFDKMLGLLIGGGIFLLITVIGGLIAGKEAMGFGDVKLMCGLGLIFGAIGIINISLMSFLIGAVLSIILLATKKKKTDEYIPFGPFIVIAAFIAMIIPAGIIVHILLEIFTLGMI